MTPARIRNVFFFVTFIFAIIPLIDTDSQWGRVSCHYDDVMIDRLIALKAVEPREDILVFEMDERSRATVGAMYGIAEDFDRLTGDILDILSTGEPSVVAVCWRGINFRPRLEVPSGTRLLSRTIIASIDSTGAHPIYGHILNELKMSRPSDIQLYPDSYPRLSPDAGYAEDRIQIDPDGLVRRAGGGDLSNLILAKLNRNRSAGRIHFAGPYKSIFTIPIWRLHAGEIPPSAWLNRVVVIGSSAVAEGQIAMTPVGPLPEAEIIAQAVNSSLGGHDLRPLNQILSILLLLLLLSTLAASGYASDLRRRMGLILFCALTYFVFVGIAFHYGRIAPFVSGILLVVLGAAISMTSYYVEEILRERHLASSFTRFLARPVAERIISAGGELPAARRKTITVMFADIRGFTAYSEKHSPNEIAAALNLHFTEVIEKVFKHGGTLDKLLGDAVMAFWGDPIDHPNPVQGALDCAVEIRRDWNRLSHLHFGDAATNLGIGIGIETGEAIVGNVGTEAFLDYTAVGDIVNVAARIMEIAKAGQILVGSGCLQSAGGSYQVQSMDKVAIRGRETPVEVWEVK